MRTRKNADDNEVCRGNESERARADGMDAAANAIAHDGTADLLRNDDTEPRPLGLANESIEHSVWRANTSTTTHRAPEIVTTDDSVCSREHRRA
ncbi:MAG: hypothetical protein RL499_745 [Actinomycetota bacterium]|jgi:hypothetical protein